MRVPVPNLPPLDGAGPEVARTLRDRVLAVLRGAIVSGRLAPGARLSEPSLSRVLKVSRGPIREAIRELAAERLVRIESRVGTFVTRLDSRGIDEAFAVDAVLEGLSARLAASVGGEAERGGRIWPLLETMEAAGETSAYLSAARRFHEGILDLAGNVTLAAIHRTLNDQLYRLCGPLLTPDQITRSAREHRAIAAAVVAGRPAQADRLARSHVTRAAGRLVERARALQARRPVG